MQLQIETEYQESIFENYFELWWMRPEPLGFSTDWLIGVGKNDISPSIAKWHNTLTEQQKAIPDVMDGYIEEDFVSSLLKAIDILCYVLPGEQQQKKANKKKGKGSAKYIVSQKWTTKKVNKDIECLLEFFLAWHNPASTCRFGKKETLESGLLKRKLPNTLSGSKKMKFQIKSE